MITYNIADLYESLADAYADREAVVCGDTRWSYAELDAEANRLAHHLAGAGVGAGDHVGLHLYNGAEYVSSMLACFKIRAVPININYRYVADELRYLFDNADLVALLYNEEVGPMAAAAAEGVATLKHFIQVPDGSGAGPQPAGFVTYADAVAAGSAARDFAPRSSDDIYVIYTGGTTGMPRGVMWRHEDVFYAGLQGGNPGGPPVATPDGLVASVAQGMALTYLPAAPFIHGAAQWAAWIALLSGGKVVIQAGRSFQADEVWRLIADEKVVTITLVGDAMAIPLADAWDAFDPKPDISSLFVVSSAGAIFSESVQQRIREILPMGLVLNSFGSTEAGHQGTAMPGTSGRLTFTMDETCTVLDDDLRPLEPGSGEVGRLARSGRLPVGYYKDPEKTARTFKTLGGKRWVLPGDMATVEADGRIRVLGRGAVCINSGGEKVYPEEVEEALKAHPAIHDALVVGVPDDRWGERVAAVVSLRAGQQATADEVQEHARAHVAGYKTPREVHFVDAVPRQPSGKPDYRAAKAIATA